MADAQITHTPLNQHQGWFDNLRPNGDAGSGEPCEPPSDEVLTETRGGISSQRASVAVAQVGFPLALGPLGSLTSGPGAFDH